MQKTSLCQVFMAAISSIITKIDKRKTFQLLIRYARLKLKTYVPSRAKRMSPLFHHQGLYSDRRIHVCLVRKFLSCSPRKQEPPRGMSTAKIPLFIIVIILSLLLLLFKLL